MKKIFSIFAAVLFAGSMFAADVTISPSDFTAAESADYSTTKSGVTVAVTASTVTAEQMRIFKGKTITISAASNITKIVFTCTANGTAKYGPGCFAAQDGYTFDASGKTGTWEGSATSVTFTAETNQVRAAQIVVTLEDGDTPAPTVADPVFDPAKGEFEESVNVTITCSTDGASIYYTEDGSDPTSTATKYTGAITLTATTTIKAIAIKGDDKSKVVSKTYTKVEPLADPTNCAEAREAALSVAANNELYNGGKVYTIEGYVTSIAYAWKDGSMSFWMADTKDGGNVIEAYKCAIADAKDAVKVGDKVAVTGKLTKFNTTPEFATGCTVEVIEAAPVVVPKNLGEKTIEEFLALKNTVDTCVLTGVVKNIELKDGAVNKYGNFDLVDAEDAEVSIYIRGLLTAAGEDQKFVEMGIEENDILTLKAVYSEYNSKPQAKNAVFVSVKKATGTAIDNATVNSNVQKMIINGQLFIIRDGVMFNANGAVVK